MDMLERLRALDKNIRVGIIGMGAMGKGLLYQCLITPGVECVAVADIQLEAALGCVKGFDVAHRVADLLAGAEGAIRDGKVAVCEDGDVLARCEGVDVVIEASSAIEAAGRFAVTALNHRKHLVLMNAEADLIFGPYLMRLASDNGVVCTSCDGDQPGVIKYLVDDLRLWGFELVMCGNMKGFLDRYSNPTKIIPEADKRNFSYKMATAYTDGTKLNIEMALLANALNLATPCPGMHGPRAARVQEVFDLLDMRSLWEAHGPFVDYVLGAEPDGGVFAVGYSENEYQRSMLRIYKMGDGPFYLFYRPYHLCYLEAMKEVALTALDGHALLQPTYGFRANVFAYAKRDLRAGDPLDGIGGYACYGLIENCPATGRHPGLPICLAEGVTLKRSIEKDRPIPLANVEYDPRRSDFALFENALLESERIRG